MSSTIESIAGADSRMQRRQRRHPWDIWTDGLAHELERGVDFDQELEAFRNRFYTKAADVGKRAVTASVLHAVDDTAADDIRAELAAATKPYTVVLKNGQKQERRPPSRVKVYSLDRLISEASGKRKLILEDRQKRLADAGDRSAEILQVQFIDA